jgi:hypothetical protein
LAFPVEVARIGLGTAAGGERVRFEPDPKLASRYSERLEHYRGLQGVLLPITRALEPKPREGKLDVA